MVDVEEEGVGGCFGWVAVVVDVDDAAAAAAAAVAVAAVVAAAVGGWSLWCWLRWKEGNAGR